LSSPDPTTVSCRVDAVGVPGVNQLVADVFVRPEAIPEHATVMVCVPGGGISRRYYDLRVPPGLGDYSMARHLASRGTIVVTVDPPGVGASDAPVDGYLLTPDVVAEMLARVASDLIDRLRDGSLSERIAPLDGLRTIGVGHSAGGLLTVVQQHHHRSYDAIAVLGFGGAGLPEFLDDRELGYAGDPAGLRDVAATLAEARFGNALPVLAHAGSDLLVTPKPPPEVMAALDEAVAPLLSVVGLTAIIPGSVADSSASIDVPVFIGIGEHDIASKPQTVAAEFTSSRDLTLFELPGAGHNHNVADGRAALWDRMLAWSESLDRASVIIEEVSG
jgi:pimeloyl-ACP methyl ester carboxylesterase